MFKKQIFNYCSLKFFHINGNSSNGFLRKFFSFTRMFLEFILVSIGTRFSKVLLPITWCFSNKKKSLDEFKKLNVLGKARFILDSETPSNMRKTTFTFDLTLFFSFTLNGFLNFKSKCTYSYKTIWLLKIFVLFLLISEEKSELLFFF